MAVGDYKSFSASMAFSAFKSYQIPMNALIMRIEKITKGSTQAGTA
jgi:hypothetical protein